MLVVISCKEENIECTVLRGFFPNSKDPSVVLYANDTPIDTVYLDKDKNFIFNLKIKESQLYNFETKGKFQYVFIEPNDSLVVYANAYNFDESISFSGRGAAINNFILVQANEARREADLFKKYQSLPPNLYKEKIDSLYQLKKNEYEAFVKVNPTLSEKAKDLALVSATFPLYKEMEIYPFVYQSEDNVPLNCVLPEDFYDYRKRINYNDTFLEYFRPYYRYMVMYVNNLAFTKYTYNKHTLVDVSQELGFHLEKIKIIDSLFSKGSLRDNLYRNAAYAYIFNIHIQEHIAYEHIAYKDYFDEFAKYNKDNEHKAELDKVFRNVIALQAGNQPPDFDLINTKGKPTKFSEIQTPKVTTIYYFWSVNQQELSNLIFKVDRSKFTIFIIDEPELSLHLSWQKKIVETIHEINKNMQLVFATHSPEIIGKYSSKAFELEKHYKPVEKLVEKIDGMEGLDDLDNFLNELESNL